MDTFAIYCELLFAGERGQRWRLIVGALNGKVAAAAAVVNVTINHEKIYLSIGSVLMAVVAISIYLYV